MMILQFVVLILIEYNIQQLNIATFSISSVKNDDGLIVGKVAGLPCEFLIDSGAQVNTLTEQRFDLLCSSEDYMKWMFNIQYCTDRPLKAYASAGEIPVLSTFEAFLHITDDRPVLLEKFYVVKEFRSLLGRATATRYSVLLLGLKCPLVHEQSLPRPLQRSDIATVWTKEVFPKFNIPPVEIHYDKTRPPCRNIFMNIPIAVKPLVKERLDQLLSSNIIEQVKDGMDTSFCSSMLAIPKGKDDIRLVIDLRGPNRYIQQIE